MAPANETYWDAVKPKNNFLGHHGKVLGPYGVIWSLERRPETHGKERHSRAQTVLETEGERPGHFTMASQGLP